MGQNSSKKNLSQANQDRQEDQHYCSVQIGYESPIRLEVAEVQRQFGQTYVHFRLPNSQRKRIYQLQSQPLDIQYQRTLGRQNPNLTSNEMMAQLEKLQDNLKLTLSNLKASRNIINGVEYQEYSCPTERGNNFTFRFGLTSKPTLLIRYMFTHG